MHTHRSAMSTLVGGVQWCANTQDDIYLAVVVLPRWDRDATSTLLQGDRITI